MANVEVASLVHKDRNKGVSGVTDKLSALNSLNLSFWTWQVCLNPMRNLSLASMH